MGTIFVAYGGSGREQVLEFAAERAAASGDDLYVYHAGDVAEEEVDPLRSEVGAVVERTAPGVAYEFEVASREAESDATNVSAQKRLVDAVLDPDREFAYAVMGNVEHGTLESLTLPSMTEAVLETNAIPVLLVPVEDE